MCVVLYGSILDRVENNPKSGAATNRRAHAEGHRRSVTYSTLNLKIVSSAIKSICIVATTDFLLASISPSLSQAVCGQEGAHYA
jgi:hypothetical protein